MTFTIKGREVVAGTVLANGAEVTKVVYGHRTRILYFANGSQYTLGTDDVVRVSDTGVRKVALRQSGGVPIALGLDGQNCEAVEIARRGDQFPTAQDVRQAALDYAEHFNLPLEDTFGRIIRHATTEEN